jgi:hypothetical protein
MFDWQEILEQRGGADGPGNDFEARVFAKIRRKKQQRQVGIGVAAVAAVALLLAVFGPFRPGDRRQPFVAAEKTEVPVSESLFFSTSDSRTRYSLQPVSLSNKPSEPQPAVNQI